MSSPDAVSPFLAPSPPHRRRRLLAALVALVAMVAALAVPATAQDAPETEDPAEAAAGWLARQFVDGERLQTSFGGTDFDDQGLTIDGIFALAATGVADEVAARAIEWLGQSAVLTSYVGDGVDSSWAGSLAKLSLAAQTRGLAPTEFGEDGIDLIARLLDREQASGRFSDLADFGEGPVDFSNAITQSLAIIALHRQGQGPSADAIDLLLQSQCSDGGFDLALEIDPGDCTSQADATSFAVQAMLAVGEPAAAGGLDHLESIQRPDGGFEGADEPSVNSTGLAAQALIAGGRAASGAEAIAFILTLQQGCDSPAGDRGGFAAGPSGFEVGTAVRATTQALPGLAGISLADLDAEGATLSVPVLDCPSAAPPAEEVVEDPVTDPVEEASEVPAPTPAAPVAQSRPTFAG